ncbi:hypothetical protein [Rubrivirga marina]|uniref:FTP domain-containing protein n=1 Tax=Rubrivirga marina TaxID=1196024 RepID=A0A271J3M0_9BACT|nr:hypothetical protein [Rubrivirga marina]PAP77950.1 hypothetical protein BSZ37_16640 [Rubrivirga marina]
MRAALCVLALVALAACGPGDESAAPVTEAGPAPADTARAPAPPPATDTTLTADGWGPLTVGMTRAELVEAVGDAPPDVATGLADTGSCEEFHPVRAPEGLLVMLEDGVLTRVSASGESEVTTPEGLGLGDAAADVEAAHGDDAVVTPHKYVEAPAAYVTVWRSGDGGEAVRGIRYEIGADATVERIHGGGPSIEYVEGCL